MSDLQSGQDDIWPKPSFQFKVTFASSHQPAFFQEVSGMETDEPVIDYRHSDIPPRIKRPAGDTNNTVTLKRGMISDRRISDWCTKAGIGAISTKDINIELMNDKGVTTTLWTLVKARPLKIITAGLQSDDNATVVELLELACERIAVNNK